MWVVKLGGSLWESTWFLEWLDRLIECRRPVVVVGGPFAEPVRTAQAHWRFDDRPAHAMAPHAMEQMARMQVDRFDDRSRRQSQICESVT